MYLCIFSKLACTRTVLDQTLKSNQIKLYNNGMNLEPNRLKVYYDGACILCSREIDHYRKKDTEQKIEYVDISAPYFDAAEEGLDPVAVNKYFHVRTKDGDVITGVSAFNAIWEELGVFKLLSIMSKLRYSRKAMDLGYVVFSKVRPWLPKRKDCENGSCQI
jgi:predicted DCC family thiol-disulfide oxidoreductase YuxK